MPLDRTKVVAPPMVYIAGEEMTRYACELVLDQWIRPYFDITTHWQYFERADVLTIRNRPTKGLGLPDETLRKFYGDSVRHWYPGL